MKQIEFKSNYGAFAYRMTASIDPDVFAPQPFTDETSTNEEVEHAKVFKRMYLALIALAEKQGLGNLCYRLASSAVDKALGVNTAKNKVYSKRIDVRYSVEDAERINHAVSTAIKKLEEEEPVYAALKLSFAVTGEYVSTTTKPSKEAEALWQDVQALPEEDFSKAMQKLGLDVENYDDETGIEACHRHLLEEKRKAAEAAKAGLGVKSR